MLVRLRRDTHDKKGGTNRFYVHEVFLEKEVATPFKTGAGPSKEGRREHTGGRDHYLMLLQNALSFKPSSVSKVIEPETGEPMVVYGVSSRNGKNRTLWTFFIIFPFTRMVHVLSGFGSVGYITRAWQLVRPR